MDEQVYDAMRGERRGITREGEEKNKENKEEQGELLTDVNPFPKISFRQLVSNDYINSIYK